MLDQYSTLSLVFAHWQAYQQYKAYWAMMDRFGRQDDNSNFSVFILNQMARYTKEINYRLYGELLPSGD